VCPLDHSLAREAQETTLGQAAKMLARLGRLHFEGVLSANDDTERQNLLTCLAGLDLPPGLPLEASEEETRARIQELIRFGNESKS
jgi:hypothetical protein